MASLVDFAHYIKNYHLEAAAAENLRMARKVNLPLMGLFFHLPENALLAQGRQGMEDFLTSIIENTYKKKQQEGLERWEKDEIPGLSKDAIRPCDLVLAYTLQKQAISEFLPLYTQDSSIAVAIIEELDNILMESQEAAAQLMFKMQQKVEDGMNENKVRLLEAQKAAKIGSWEWDIYSDTIKCSEQLYDICGIDPESFNGNYNEYVGLLHPNDKNSVAQLISEAISNKTNLNFFNRIIRKTDGVVITIKVIGRPILNDEGEVEKLLGTAQDVTETKEVEKRLLEETAYTKLLQTIAVIANEATYFEEAAKACMYEVCMVTGWPLAHLYKTSKEDNEKLISTNLWHIKNKNRFELFRNITESTDFKIGIGLPGRVLQTKRPAWIFDVMKDRNFPRNKIADDLGIRSGFAFPILVGNEVGAVLEFFSSELIQRNERLLELVYHIGAQLGRVLERSRSAELLKMSEGQIRAIVSTAYDAFILINSKGEVIDWNPQSEETFGWKREEVLGRRLSEVIIPIKYREAHEKGMAHFNKTGEGPVLNKRLELYALHKDDHEFPVELTISSVKINDVHVFAAFLHDISARKNAELELIKAKENAEKSVIVKKQFLANMSHEIRTPMNGILGFAKLLEETKLTSEQKIFLKVIHDSGQNLLNIINDILDFSKIEAQKIVFEQTPFKLGKVINAVFSLIQNKAEEKGIKLLKKINNQIPPVLVGDPLRLNQILVNFVSNGVKFTKSGKVLVSVDIESEDTDSIDLIFNIIDTGIGIPEESISDIFESFTQVGNSTTRMYGGTGLGLSIAKQLIELQGGRIVEVKSEIGKGTCFTFSLKFKKHFSENAEDVDTNHTVELLDLSSINVLLVEDNHMNQLLARTILCKWGVNTDLAENGKEALGKINEKKYDVILMDIHMPEMDGYEATIELRKKHSKKQLPIIAMTADAIVGEKEKCFQIGMNDYISKPFNSDELNFKIYQLLNGKK